MLGDRDELLSTADVAKLLGYTKATVRELIHSGKLAAVRVGGHGQWRVRRGVVEALIGPSPAASDPAAASKPGGRDPALAQAVREAEAWRRQRGWSGPIDAARTTRARAATR